MIPLINIDTILNKLNTYQLEAVTNNSPVILVNANVGSGKTTVLISKIFYMHLTYHLPLTEFVVLTFTNKAANEIKERIIAMDSSITDDDMPYFGTFHSVALKLLRTALPIETIGYQNDFAVIDPDELVDIGNDLIEEHALTIKYLNKLMKRIDLYKQGTSLYANMKKQDDIKQLWSLLCNEKKLQNKMDFDDLIENSTILLKNHKMTPKWVVIDEFQDCEPKQMNFIDSLLDANTQIFAVGDPNQIIYSWRGSNKNIFSDFKKDYHAFELSLPINYRSSNTILEAAKHFLNNGSNLEGIKEQGNKITVKNHHNSFSEADYLTNKIKLLHDEGINYNNIAILYRLQSQSLALTSVFEKESIPYEVSMRKTLRDIPVLLWFTKLLRTSVNPSDTSNLISVLSNPNFPTGLSLGTARKIVKNKDTSQSLLYQQILNFRSWSKQHTKAIEIYEYFTLDDYISPTSANYNEYKTYITSLLEKLDAYLIYKNIDLFQGTQDYINSSTLYGVDMLKDDIHITENTVKLMTLHACKGLEFQYVFIVGTNYGLIPLHKTEPEDLEEEKRLFFVGITRAKDFLEISYYTSPDNFRVFPGPSRYLDMIPASLLSGRNNKISSERTIHDLRKEIKENIRTGSAFNFFDPLPDEKTNSTTLITDMRQKVSHLKYGIGYVESEDDNLITVIFDDYGSKSFSKLFNPLVIL